MIYNIVSPFQYEIQGDDYTTAIKNFVKLNHDLQIHQMIIRDRQKYMMANMRYYKQNQKNKIGIDTYPLNYIPIINNNNMPYNMFIKINTKKKEEDTKETEEKKEEEKKEEEKELSHKLIVPTQLPSIYPNTNIPSPYVPVVYNVYKNKQDDNDSNTIKFIVPPLYPNYNPYYR